MKFLSRVVWSEGMHLAQHHFQAQTSYFESVTTSALQDLVYCPYGVAAIEMDAEALLNGTVSITHARGIMPDGLSFQFPLDPLPQPLDVREIFSPTHDSHLVLLGIPPVAAGRANCALGGATNGDGLRFTAVPSPVVDEITAEDEKPVSFARKNFRLLLDVEADEDLVTLPLARVRRDGAGHFIYDAEYIPPCLQIGASARLLEVLARLIEILDAKAQTMLAERQATHGMVAEYAAREIAGFWLTHAVNAGVAPLRHHLRTRTAHPEALFQSLSQLAGSLCTFSLSSHPRELPLYDHDHLDICLGALDRHIRDHLEIIRPTNAVTLPLKQADQYLYTAAIADQRCFGKAHWFLGVRSSSGPGEVSSRVPRLVKICSAKHIVRLVKEAYPGLGLTHVASPPAALSPRLGTQYFSMQRTEPCWKSIVETGQLGVYVPAAVPDVELDLVVVFDG